RARSSSSRTSCGVRPKKMLAAPTTRRIMNSTLRPCPGKYQLEGQEFLRPRRSTLCTDPIEIRTCAASGHGRCQLGPLCDHSRVDAASREVRQVRSEGTGSLGAHADDL